MEFTLAARLFNAFFVLLCMTPFLMLIGCMVYVMYFEGRGHKRDFDAEGYGDERCMDPCISTLNCNSHRCFHCQGWIPKNTFGGGLKCSHCNRWQPERRSIFPQRFPQRTGSE